MNKTNSTSDGSIFPIVNNIDTTQFYHNQTLCRRVQEGVMARSPTQSDLEYEGTCHAVFTPATAAVLDKCCPFGTLQLTHHNFSTSLFDAAKDDLVGVSIGCTWIRSYFEGRSNYTSADACIEKETGDNKTMIGGGTWGESGVKPYAMWSKKSTKSDAVKATGLKLSNLIVGGLLVSCVFAIGL